MRKVERVKMIFPENGNEAETSERAFTLVWEPKGWTRAEPVSQETNDDTAVNPAELPEMEM